MVTIIQTTRQAREPWIAGQASRFLSDLAPVDDSTKTPRADIDLTFKNRDIGVGLRMLGLLNPSSKPRRPDTP